MSTRWEHFIGDGIAQPITIKHDGVAITLISSDIIKVQVIGDSWVSSVITVDISVTPHADTDLPNGKFVAEFTSAETGGGVWLPGAVVWEVERTESGGEPQTYQYLDARLLPSNIP